MLIKRFCSIPPKYNQIIRFCQKSIESIESIKKINKKEKYKMMLLESKIIFLETLPIFILGTVWISMFNYNQKSNCSFLEHCIYSATTGCFIGATYPVSYPIIAYNVWLKRNEEDKV